MRILSQALPVLLGASVLVGLGDQADTVRHAPRADTSQRCSWTEELTWALEDMEMDLDGSPVEQEMPDAGGTARLTLEVVDELLAVEEDRVQRRRRTFEEIATKTSFHVDLGDGDETEYGIGCTSGLVDTAVVFSWDEEDEEYDVAFDEERAGDSDLLDGLEADLDFTAFLPEGEVEENDEWDVDPSRLRHILAPGGGLHTTPDTWVGGGIFSVPTATIVASSLTTLPESATGEIDGEVTARYGGTVEEDGIAFAVIELDVDVTIETDKTDRYRAHCAKVIGDEGHDQLVLEDEVDFVGKGRLLWDVEAGRWSSFELEAEIMLVADVAWTESIIVDSDPMVFTGSYEISGTTTIAATCTEE